MTGAITHRVVEANGIHLHIAEQGEGPLVVLCHGFPESWYSWRHQLAALSAAGFRAVAPDMRGYGRSDRPDAVEQYTLLHLVGDMVGLVDALGVDLAVIAGHDWGAPVAWHAALLRPDRFRAVIGLSVPFIRRGLVPPTSRMPRSDDATFYQLYFQKPGVAEAELERDVRTSIAKLIFSASGDVPRRGTGGSGGQVGMVPHQGGFLSRMASPSVLPAWLTEADLDFYVAEFERTGLTGGLNRYRNVDRDWEDFGAFTHTPIRVPSLFIGGQYDGPTVWGARAIARFDETLPNLWGSFLIDGCGHWVQQERAEEVNRHLIDFLAAVGR